MSTLRAGPRRRPGVKFKGIDERAHYEREHVFHAPKLEKSLLRTTLETCCAPVLNPCGGEVDKSWSPYLLGGCVVSVGDVELLEVQPAGFQHHRGASYFVETGSEPTQSSESIARACSVIPGCGFYAVRLPFVSASAFFVDSGPFPTSHRLCSRITSGSGARSSAYRTGIASGCARGNGQWST